MNNELIGRIDRMLCCYPTKTINKVLQDCKAALTQQQQEAEPVVVESFRNGRSAVVTGDSVFSLDIGDKLYLHLPKPAAQPVDADALSNFIRKIDGNNSMGAGALAEAIAEWIGAQAAHPQVPEGHEWTQHVYWTDSDGAKHNGLHPSLSGLLSAAKEEGE